VWATDAQDTYTKLDCEGNVYRRTGLTWFFDWIEPDAAERAPFSAAIANNGAYFTVSLTVPYLFAGIGAGEEFSVLFLETVYRGNGVLDVYNSAPFIYGMRLNGAPCGDPAYQGSYVDVGVGGMKTLTAEQKKTLVAGAQVSFAAPADTVAKADEFYVEITRTGNALHLGFTGFGALKYDEFITVVIHAAGTNGENWALQPGDAMLKITKEGAVYYKTGLASFWDWQDYSASDKKLSNNAVYTAMDGYFTVDLNIALAALGGYGGDIGLLFAECRLLSPTAMEIYNTFPFTSMMRYKQTPCGDPAFQARYIKVSADGVVSV
jgi:hypothetical protein